jgi:RNA 3'-terminal phosphate cyclase (ATP)
MAKEARRHLDADVPVGEHLADQILLSLAIAAGGSFRTLPSPHTPGPTST